MYIANVYRTYTYNDDCSRHSVKILHHSAWLDDYTSVFAHSYSVYICIITRTNLYINIYVNVHTHTDIYIYIYIQMNLWPFTSCHASYSLVFINDTIYYVLCTMLSLTKSRKRQKEISIYIYIYLEIPHYNFLSQIGAIFHYIDWIYIMQINIWFFFPYILQYANMRDKYFLLMWSFFISVTS